MLDGLHGGVGESGYIGVSDLLFLVHSSSLSRSTEGPERTSSSSPSAPASRDFRQDARRVSGGPKTPVGASSMRMTSSLIELGLDVP